jgi:hypothetical protein
MVTALLAVTLGLVPRACQGEREHSTKPMQMLATVASMTIKKAIRVALPSNPQ